MVGGAIRSMQASELKEVHNFPIMSSFEERKGNFDEHSNRNNIVVASRQALDPRGNAAGWERYARLPLIPIWPSIPT